MVVDIGEVKRYIKPKADSTLHNMRKDDLIKYIRILESNYNTAVSFNENQARYIESLDIAKARCGDCRYRSQYSDENGMYHCGGIDTTKNHALPVVAPDFFCAHGERRCNDGNKPWQNKSGLPDPTAYKALYPTEESKRVSSFVDALRVLAGLCGFDILNWVKIRVIRTGNEY